MSQGEDKKVRDIGFNLQAAIINILITLALAVINSYLLYWAIILFLSDLDNIPMEVAIVFGCFIIPSILLSLIIFFQPTIIASNININNWKRNPISIFGRFFVSLIYVAFYPLIFIFREFVFKLFLINVKKGKIEGINRDYFLSLTREDQKFFFKMHFKNHMAKEKGDADYPQFGTYEKVQHPKLMWIFLLNIFLGGTFVFWVIAFFWAFDHRTLPSVETTETPSQSPQSTGSLSDELVKLTQLKEAGVLSEGEFAKAKAKLLE